MTTGRASERMEMSWNQKSNLLKNHFTVKRYHLNALEKFGQLYTEFWIRVREVFRLILKLSTIIIQQMAENLTGTKPTTKNEITQQIKALSSSSNQDQFYLQTVHYNKLLHEIKSIRSDCSTGTDNINIKSQKKSHHLWYKSHSW